MEKKKEKRKEKKEKRKKEQFLIIPVWFNFRKSQQNILELKLQIRYWNEKRQKRGGRGDSILL